MVGQSVLDLLSDGDAAVEYMKSTRPLLHVISHQPHFSHPKLPSSLLTTHTHHHLPELKMATVYRGVNGSAIASPFDLPSELGPKQILMKITHSSLCGTDVHYLSSGMALGHEGIGIVEKIGSEVTQFQVGDRAGAGYIRDVSLSKLLGRWERV
jgi:hypothetical protein